MSIEAWKIKEQEKEKKSFNEKDRQKEELRQREYQKIKEKINITAKTDKDLEELKELFSKWLISKETLDSIIKWKNIAKDEIDEIFNKIDEIEVLKEIDKYLPKELRITKDEYLKAIKDPIFKTQVLVKINTALTIISNQITWDSPLWLNLFSWYLMLLDKNLFLVQENTIDIKESLDNLEEKKKVTLLGKIIKFFSDLFLNK